MMITLKFALVLLLAFLFSNVGAHAAKPKKPESVEGSTWRYEDGDITYEVTFDAEGNLITSHPNDTTPANDFWSFEGEQVVFSFNNNFSVYKGKFVSDNLIAGTASNATTSWSWKLYRVDSNPNTQILASNN